MSGADKQRSIFRAGTRTDAILIVLPIAFIGTFLLSHGTWASSDAALTVASIVCVSLIVDRLFVHPPTETE